MAHPLSRTDVRIGLIVSAVVLTVGAAALIAVSVLGEERTVRPLGRVLSIAVVAPVEPEVLPGETMEVGALKDGFDRAALAPAADPTLDETYLPPAAYVGASWDGAGVSRMPAPTLVAAAAAQTDRPMPERPVEGVSVDPLADGSHLFGFDRLQAARTDGPPEQARPALPIATSSAPNETRGPVPYLSE